jgi:hypothetical protein
MNDIAFLLAAIAAGYVGSLLARKNHRSSPGTSNTFHLLRAENIELIDSSGNTRGTFSLVDGKPRIALYGSSGIPRGMFGLASDDDPIINLIDSNGRIRGLVGYADGESFIEIYDAEGRGIWQAH